MKQAVFSFIKKETVLVVATILAIISAFWVRPDKAYFSYIDWRVLGILLSLMYIMAGFQKHGVFQKIGKWLLQKTRNTVQLAAVLVFLCFFFSMFITNDVALLTFVPFTMLILKSCKQEKMLIPVIVLQTLAANLGSMLTPIGNPQNLYLYQLGGFSIGEFVQVMLPYTVTSGILLLAGVLLLGRQKETITVVIENEEEGPQQKGLQGKQFMTGDKPQRISLKCKITIYTFFFLLSLLVVGRMIPWYLVLTIIFLAVFVLDRDVLRNVDYCLLLTFISFFIFTGNMGRIPSIQSGLQQMVAGHEQLIGILASQVISNVPATLLLSGFTDNLKGLLVGVNLGGLGTLIASMASLISYKIYAHQYNEKKGRYFLWFTLANIFYLLVLLLVAFVLSK